MTVLDFIIAHPFPAFLLALPTSLVLISISWSTATIITNALSATTNLIGQCVSMFVILVRGYASPAPDDSDSDADGSTD